MYGTCARKYCVNATILDNVVANIIVYAEIILATFFGDGVIIVGLSSSSFLKLSKKGGDKNTAQ